MTGNAFCWCGNTGCLPRKAFGNCRPASWTGEKALQAARRELTEETGYRARGWKKLAAFYPIPGYVGEHMTIFPGVPNSPKARLRRWMTSALNPVGSGPGRTDEMYSRTGKIEDGKTMIGFLTWKRYIKK